MGNSTRFWRRERDGHPIRRDHHRHRPGGPAAGGAAVGGGHEGRDRRARSLRRHLRQHGLHSDEDAGRERTPPLRRCAGPPSSACRSAGAVTRRHEGASRRARTRSRASRATGVETMAPRPRQRHGLRRPRALRVAARGAGRRRASRRAERIFINVGGRASIPPMPGLAEIPYLDEPSMMAVDFVPPHLVVVGGSYVGLEFAQMYRRFGSEVTVIEMVAAAGRARGRGRLRGDPRHPRARGHRGAHGSRVHRASRSADRACACASIASEGEPAVDGSHLLLAVGRRPNTDDLGARAGRRRGRRARLHPGRRRAAHERRRGSGRWATATARARSPTPRTTTSRSSPPTFSTTIRAGSATASRPTRCSSIRRSGAPA